MRFWKQSRTIHAGLGWLLCSFVGLCVVWLVFKGGGLCGPSARLFTVMAFFRNFLPKNPKMLETPQKQDRLINYAHSFCGRDYEPHSSTLVGVFKDF